MSIISEWYESVTYKKGKNMHNICNEILALSTSEVAKLIWDLIEIEVKATNEFYDIWMDQNNGVPLNFPIKA